MDWSVKVTDLAIVFATFMGPLAALAVQRKVDESREQRRRRSFIFTTLMRERLSLSVEHVQALNLVPVEFSSSQGKVGEVKRAWKVYLNHMNRDTVDPAWLSTRVTLFIDLLQKMGRCLDYDFDPVELEREFYAPKGHTTIASDQEVIREGLAAVFRGDKPLPMAVVAFPGDPEYLAQLKAVLAKLDGWLERNPGAAPQPTRRTERDGARSED